MRTLSLSAVAATLALTLAACGGADKNAYVESVTKVQQKTQNEANQLTTEMAEVKSAKGIGRKLEELGTQVGTNAKELAAIEAPEEVTAEHEQYVQLMTRFSSELERLGGEFERAKNSELSGILTETTKLTADLQADEQKIVNNINTKLKG